MVRNLISFCFFFVFFRPFIDCFIVVLFHRCAVVFLHYLPLFQIEFMLCYFLLFNFIYMYAAFVFVVVCFVFIMFVR